MKGLIDPVLLSMSIAHIMTIFLLVKIVMPQQSTILILASNLKDIVRSKLALFYFLSFIFILWLNYYYTKYLDIYFTTWLQQTYDPTIYNLEGDLVARIQQWHNFSLTYLLSLVYIFIYPNLVAVVLIVLNTTRNTKGLLFLWLIFMFNYLGALPFYMFVPVREVWVALPHKVQPLMKDLFPGFVALYRPMSGIDNCFPSLHTSISLSMALCAYRAGHRRLFYVTFGCTLLVIYGVLYLGVHWVTDVVAGIIYAWVCYFLAAVLEPRLAAKFIK